MKSRLPSLAIFLFLALLALSGCGTKIGTGTVNVGFINNTAATMRGALNEVHLYSSLQMDLMAGGPYLGDTPTIYRMKLVALYLAEDVDPQTQNNVGNVTRIWTSNKCDDDLTLCGIGPSAGQYIVDYFDFAVGTAAVNAAFASYQRDTKESQVNPGTYRYLRIDFAGATGSQDPAVPNLEFGTSTAFDVRSQINGLTIDLTADPVVINAGDTIKVDLSYSLDDRFYPAANSASPPAEVASDDKWTCDGTGAAVPCVVEPVFVPTVSKP